jgi:hypothetical protein
MVLSINKTQRSYRDKDGRTVEKKPKGIKYKKEGIDRKVNKSENV